MRHRPRSKRKDRQAPFLRLWETQRFGLKVHLNTQEVNGPTEVIGRSTVAKHGPAEAATHSLSVTIAALSGDGDATTSEAPATGDVPVQVTATKADRTLIRRFIFRYPVGGIAFNVDGRLDGPKEGHQRSEGLGRFLRVPRRLTLTVAGEQLSVLEQRMVFLSRLFGHGGPFSRIFVTVFIKRFFFFRTRAVGRRLADGRSGPPTGGEGGRFGPIALAGLRVGVKILPATLSGLVSRFCNKLRPHRRGLSGFLGSFFNLSSPIGLF